MIKYKIMKYKLIFNNKTILWLETPDISKVEDSVFESLLKLINRNKRKKLTKKELIDKSIIEKCSQPHTFPLYNETMNLKIKGYNAYNPKMTEIIWTETNGWQYNFENVGHKIQWIKESDIKLLKENKKNEKYR